MLAGDCREPAGAGRSGAIGRASMSPDHLPVSLDVFAIWRGMQDWIVETVLLSPLDFSLRLMPSRKTPCSDRFREGRPTGHAVELHRPR